MPTEPIPNTSTGIFNPLRPQQLDRRNQISRIISRTDTIDQIVQTTHPDVINPNLYREILQANEHMQPKHTNLQFIAPKTLVGLEVEVENVIKVDPNIQLHFWQIKTDGSLRNNGFEFATKGAIPIVYVEAALRQLFGGLNSTIDFSPRTSIHVHLDVRQLTLPQLLVLTCAYGVVENVLFKFVGAQRRNNIFCVPLVETGLFHCLASDDPGEWLAGIEKSWAKYAALNLSSLFRFGTIEFRQLPGTSDIFKILCWCELLVRFRTFAYRRDYDYLRQKILQLNSNSYYLEFIREIFDEMTSYLDCNNLLADMEQPVYIIKNSTILNTFNTHITQSPLAQTSQLHKFRENWARALSPEQYKALVKFCQSIKTTDLRAIYYDILEKFPSYLSVYPQHTALLKCILAEAPDSKLRQEIPDDEESYSDVNFE